MCHMCYIGVTEGKFKLKKRRQTKDKHLFLNLHNKLCLPKGVQKIFILLNQVAAEKTLTKNVHKMLYRSDRRKNLKT